MSRRFGLVLAAVLLVGSGLAWFTAEGVISPDTPGALQPEQYYAVEVVCDRAALDLEFQRDTRYVLLLSSLGYAGRAHEISLDSRPASTVGSLPARKIQPLQRSVQRGRLKNRLRLTTAGSTAASRDTATDAPNATAFHSEANTDEDKNAPARRFYIHVTDGDLDDAKQYVSVWGRVVAEGREARIYLDRQQKPDELSPGTLDEIVRLFDTEIVPAFRNRLGCCRDADGDGKFTVLISPWLGRLQGGQTSLGGFVRGSDFRPDVAAPFSNHCDMLYLNSSVRPGPHLQNLLVHEYTHAVCFGHRSASAEPAGRLPDEDDWLNEAIAHVVENFHGNGWTNLDYRISRFLDQPQSYPLVVGSYYRAGMWRNHGCRGATYLFLRWCVDQYGDELLADVIDNPVRGTRNLEWATGVKFDELFRRWSIGLFESGRKATARGGQSSSVDHRDRPDSSLSGSPRWQSGAGAGPANDDAFPSMDSFTSIDLRGGLGDWGLTGPRPIVWDVDSPAPKLHVKGTATAFVELCNGGPSGVRRIRIRGEYGTRLQVSIVKLSASRPRLRVHARLVDTQFSPETSAMEMTADRALEVHVGGGDETPLRLETLACERNQGNTKQSVCFQADRLSSLPQADFGFRPSARFERTYLLPIPLPANDETPLVVKAVARDSRGWRAVAVTTLDESAVGNAHLRVAESSSPSGRTR